MSFGVEGAMFDGHANYVTFNDVLRGFLLALNMLLCAFLLVSSAVGLTLLKRAGMSRENIVGLQKLLGVSIVLFVTTVFRSINRIMTWRGRWIEPEWFEYGIDYVGMHALTVMALFYFVFSAMRAKRSNVQGREIAVEMSQKLLGVESVESETTPVPKAYLV